MLDIGFQELLILMVIALLVFGPYKLPELGRALGRAMREFRRASDEFRSTIETNLNLHDDSPGLSSSGDAAGGRSPEELPATVSSFGTDSTTIPSPSDPVPFGTTALQAAADTGDGAASVPVGIRAEIVDPFSTRRGGRLLHRSTCAWVSRIPESERVVLKRAAEGIELGLAQCPVCDPVDAD